MGKNQSNRNRETFFVLSLSFGTAFGAALGAIVDSVGIPFGVSMGVIAGVLEYFLQKIKRFSVRKFLCSVKKQNR